jgi:hypothetical protein
MGCGGSSLKIKLDLVDIPVYPRVDVFGKKEINDFFKSSVVELKKVEKFRETYVDKYEQLLIMSGACAWKSNDFEKIYTCFLVNCELEINDFMSTVVETPGKAPFFKTSAKLVRNWKLYEALLNYLALTLCKGLGAEPKFDNEKSMKIIFNNCMALLSEDYNDASVM